ncbi:MAG: hypothetical protein R6V10_15170 [bacterium]
MIDWDELLEDVNWGKTISLLVVCIIIIVAVILVLLDNTRARNLEIQLQADLDNIELAKDELKTPPENEIQKIKQEINSLQSRLERNPVRTPTKFDLEKVEQDIRSLAQRTDINVVSISHRDWDTETQGYAVIYNVNVAFSAQRLNDARAFIDGLDRMPYPVAISYPQLNAGKRMECTIGFYVFDQESWETDHTCNPDVEVPDIPLQKREEQYQEVFLSFFKEDAKELLEKVKRERAGLADVKAEYRDHCTLKNRRDRLETRLGILEKAGE